MHESQLSHMIDPVREMLYQSDHVLRSYRERSGLALAGLSCDFVPPEIMASSGIVPLRVPAHSRANCCCDEPGPCGDLPGPSSYDFYIRPGGCPFAGQRSAGPAPLYDFTVPAGYGENARVALDQEISAILKKTGARQRDTAGLRDCADEYNVMRRLMRGILSVRSGKPGLMSHSDLSVMVEAASVFPPEVMLEPLAGLLQELNSRECPAGRGVPAMVYGGFLAEWSVLDDIEEAGCLIVEDDLCNGRRHFDLSINVSAEDLRGEILDAFTYRPLCPRVRRPEERFELLYRLLKSHGIDLVIFFTDGWCAPRSESIEYLRVRLMRSGVDPLLVTTDSAVESVRDYLRRR